MSSIVLELRRDALDRSVRVTDLLRKALVVARKLGLSEFKQWISNELNGYVKPSEIPLYRKLSGKVRGWNPYHGWIPVIMRDPKTEGSISTRSTSQAIAEIENLLEKGNSSSSLHMPFSPEQQQILRRSVDFDTEFILEISSTSLVGIVDVVRNTVLNWALKLEEDGVSGEGLSFTQDEKEIVACGNYNITNFYGDVRNAQIQQASPKAQQQFTEQPLDVESILALIAQLQSDLADLSLDQDQRSKLDSEISTVEAQARSPRPKRSIVRESLRTIKTILESASGGAAAHVLIKLGKLLV